MSKAQALSGMPDRNQRRGLDRLRDMQQGFNLVFILFMECGQHGAESERAGGQEKILDSGIDRRAPRNGSRPWTRVAVVDAREDEHGHAGYLLREFRAVSVRLG